MFRNPPPEALRTLLAGLRTVAIVGASPKPERPSHAIGRFLQARGLRVIPIHPALDTLFGERAYPTLAAVPEPIDLANFFINAARVGPRVDDAIACGIPAVWLQDEVVDEAAAARARAAGLQVVMDDCILRRWRELMR